MEKRAEDIAERAPTSHPEPDSIGRAIVAEIRDRIISFKTMDPPLRLLVALAIAQLIAAAILIGASSIGSQANDWIFDATVVSLALAWSFVLCGALESHWSVMLLVLSLFTYVMWTDRIAFAPSAAADPRAALMSLRIVLLVLVWVLAGYLSVRRRLNQMTSRQEQTLRFRLRFAFLALILLGYYFLVHHFLTRAGADLFYRKIGHEIRDVALIVTPALLLAATDWVDIIEVASQATGRDATRRSQWLLLVAVAGTTALVALIAGLADAPAALQQRLQNFKLDKYQILYEIGFIACVTIPLVIALRRTRISPSKESTVPFWAVAAAAMFLCGGNVIAGKLASYRIPPNAKAEVAFARYRDADDGFSMAYPAGWTVSRTSTVADDVVAFNGSSAGDNAEFLRIYQLKTDAFGFQDLLKERLCDYLYPTCKIEMQLDWGSTKEYGFSDPPKHTEGTFYVIEAGDHRHIVGGVSQDRYFWSYYFPLLVAFKNGYSSDANAAVPPPVETRFPLREVARSQSFGMLPLVLVLIGFLMMTRSHRDDMQVPGLFILMTGFVGMTFFPIRPFGAIEKLQYPLLAAQLMAAAATLTISIVTLLSSGSKRARMSNLLALLFTLCAGIFGLRLLYMLYGESAAAEETSALVAALLLLLFMLWDILMSGKEVTNIHGKIFPRHARVLLYLGYIMLVSTAIVYFSLQSNGGYRTEPFIEAEDVVREGFLRLGLPLLLTGFILGALQWWREGLPGKATETVAEPLPSAPIAPTATPVAKKRKLHIALDCLKVLLLLAVALTASLVVMLIYLGIPWRMEYPYLVWSDGGLAIPLMYSICAYGFILGAIAACIVAGRRYKGLPGYFLVTLVAPIALSIFGRQFYLTFSASAYILSLVVGLALMYAWMKAEPWTRKFLATL